MIFIIIFRPLCYYKELGGWRAVKPLSQNELELLYMESKNVGQALKLTFILLKYNWCLVIVSISFFIFSSYKIKSKFMNTLDMTTIIKKVF